MKHSKYGSYSESFVWCFNAEDFHINVFQFEGFEFVQAEDI
jgi:hypothetical protein